MSKKTIETIREAEVKADAIRADAVRRAAEMQAQAEADGKRLCEETEKNTTVALKQMMADMQVKADELKKRSDGSNLDIKKAAPGGRLFYSARIEQMFYFRGDDCAVSKMQKDDSG